MTKTIIVNGASSSGRTSLVDRFCSLTNGEYRGVYIDEYIKNLPDGLWDRCSSSDQGWVEIGMSFNNYLATLRQKNEKVIADAFYKLPEGRNHLFDTIGRDKVFYVQMYCDLEILEKRELSRMNRRKGLARSQFDSIYTFQDYDLLINSNKLDIDQCAHLLFKEVSNHALHTDGNSAALHCHR